MPAAASSTPSYKNLSTRAEGNEGWMVMLILGVVLPGAGVMAISTFGVFPIILGSIFIAVGTYTLFRGARILQAVRTLRQKGL